MDASGDVNNPPVADSTHLSTTVMPLQVLKRMERVLGEESMRRVLVSRRLSFDEFNRFVQLAHVVLDPFPVGGGRSSFEV